MPALPIVLLPGLDGTGDLFEPLIQSAPEHFRPVRISLPELTDYRELLESIRKDLPAGEFAVLGESFSGPLATAVAREYSDRVVGLILCNSFVEPPLPALFRFFPWSLLFVFPPPRWAVRRFFVGRDASSELVSLVGNAVARTPRHVLAGRMHTVFKLPKYGDLPPMDIPVLLLSGNDDRLVSMDTRTMERVSSHVVKKRIAGPHLLLQAAPVQAWDAISEFLAGVM